MTSYHEGVPMDVQLINTVLLAEKYERLVQWYVDTLELVVKLKVDKNEGFTYGSFSDPEGNPVWVMENFDFD